MCRLRYIAMHDYQESVTIEQTDVGKKLSLCVAMLCRWHKNTSLLLMKKVVDYTENLYLIICTTFKST